MKALAFLLVLAAALVAAPSSAHAQANPPAPDSVAAAPERNSGETTRRPRARRNSRTTITREEIADTRLSDAYSVIQRLRPGWLRRRGAAGADGVGVVVYRDLTPEGQGSALRGMAAENIVEIRYYDPISARARWGVGHDFGAIVVVYAGVPSGN